MGAAVGNALRYSMTEYQESVCLRLSCLENLDYFLGVCIQASNTGIGPAG